MIPNATSHGLRIWLACRNFQLLGNQNIPLSFKFDIKSYVYIMKGYVYITCKQIETILG